jgi:putative transport protein
MIDVLIANPLLLLFVVTALGYWIGNIRVKGTGLGVAAVLFVGLGVGALDPALHIPDIIIFLGLTIFVYTIGLQSGPGFFRNIKQHGIRDVLFVVLMLSLSAGLAIGLHFLFHFEPSTTAGLFAGVTTNTAALAGLLDVISNNYAPDIAAQLSKEAVVGYSLSYPMGVLGVMMAIAFVEKVMKINYSREEESLRKFYPIDQDMKNTALRITNLALQDRPLRDLIREHKWEVVFGRILRDNVVSLTNWDLQLREGDVIKLVGNREEVDRVIGELGEEVSEEMISGDAAYETARIFVSNPKVAGQKLAALNLPQKFSAIISRYRRGDIDLLASGDTILELGDQVRFVARREDIPDIAKLFGNSYEHLSHVNLLSFGLGMALGLMFGLMEFSLPGGSSFKLGFAGGPLLVALVLGSLRRTGAIVWTMPYSANLTLRQIGLTLLLAGIGINSGHTFLSTISGGGGGFIFLSSVIISIMTAIITLVIGAKLVKIPFSFLTGMVANQPAILDFAVDRAANKLPNIGFTTMLPVALITKIVFVQLLFNLLN